MTDMSDILKDLLQDDKESATDKFSSYFANLAGEKYSTMRELSPESEKLEEAALNIPEAIFEREGNRKWTPDEIREKLKTDDKWLYRGILAIYKYQLDDEKSSAGTHHLNGVGFNKFDAQMMTDSAIAIQQTGRLPTVKWREAARRRMLKYSGQLARIANNVN